MRADTPGAELPLPWQHVVMGRWDDLEIRLVFKPTAALVDPAWIGLEFRNDSSRRIAIHQLVAFARMEMSSLSLNGRTWSSREWLGDITSDIEDQLRAEHRSSGAMVPPGITRILVSPSAELGTYLGDPDRWPSNGSVSLFPQFTALDARSGRILWTQEIVGDLATDATGPIALVIPASEPPPGLRPPWESDDIPPC